MEILPEIQRWIAANRKDRNLGEIAEDLEEQLAWLFRQRLRLARGLRRPARIPAPPAGDPLAARPAVLAAHRQGSGENGAPAPPVAAVVPALDRQRRKIPRSWPHGWALEEYRVSLFAPDVPLLGKVSEKRIEEMVFGYDNVMVAAGSPQTPK